MDVIVFGSAIVDFICYVPRLPKSGETLHGSKFATGFGGKGANQCVAAAKLGANTSMIAKLGDDSWGRDYLENLKGVGVNVDHVEIIPGETTGIAQINVSDKGENQIVIVTGANNHLLSNDVASAADLFASAKVLICQLETPIAATTSALKMFQGVSILNAAPALEDTAVELLRLSTILCVNELEAALMTRLNVKNISDAKAAVVDLISQGANTVIVTLGEQGAVYGRKDSNDVIHVKVPEKVEKVVDTTGAGDAFIGSLAYFLAKFPKYPLHQHIGAACRVASISVQNRGTQTSFPVGKNVNIDFEKNKFEWSNI